MLIRTQGVYGLAIAFSISSMVNMALLLFFLRKRLSGIDGGTILDSTLRIIAASAVGGLAAQVAKILVGTQGELDTFIEVLIQLVVAGSVGLAAFCLASYYLQVKEFFQFTDSVTRKIFKAKKLITEDTGEVTGI